MVAAAGAAAGDVGASLRSTKILPTFLLGLVLGVIVSQMFSGSLGGAHQGSSSSSRQQQCASSPMMDAFFDAMATSNTADASASERKDAMLRDCKQQFEQYVKMVEDGGYDEPPPEPEEDVKDEDGGGDGGVVVALPNLYDAVDDVSQLSVGNSDVQRAKQQCRWKSSNFDPSPFVSGDAFRHFCDFQWSRDANDRSCTLTGDEPFFPGCSIFVKTDYTVPFFKTIHPKIKVPYVLVTHNSDYAVPIDGNKKWEGRQEIEEVNSNTMTAWFGQNMNSDSNPDKLFHIPIGIQNVQWKNPEVFSKVMAESETSDRSSCLAFSSWRQTTGYRSGDDLKYVKNLSESDSQFVTWEAKSQEEWIQQVLKCKYVVCPRGNGLDTHRHWESIMLGAIPIIAKGTLDPLYSTMPMLVLDSFYNVTKELLEAEYADMKARLDKERPKAFASYWLRKIRAKQNEAAELYSAAESWVP